MLKKVFYYKQTTILKKGLKIFSPNLFIKLVDLIKPSLIVKPTIYKKNYYRIYYRIHKISSTRRINIYSDT